MNDGHQGNFLKTYIAEKDLTLFLGLPLPRPCLLTNHVSTSAKGSEPPNLLTSESESIFLFFSFYRMFQL